MAPTVESCNHPPQLSNPHRQAAEWGAAAMWFGAVVAIIVPLLLIVLFLGDYFAWHGALLSDSDLDMAIMSGYAVACCVLGMASLGVMFGLIGVISALARRQAFGLAVGGTLMSAVAVVFAVVLFFATVAIGKDLRTLQKQQQPFRGPGPLQR